MINSDAPLVLQCTEELSEPSYYFCDMLEKEYFSPNYLHYFTLLSPQAACPMISSIDARGEILDWLMKISAKLHLSRETTHTAITIFDITVPLCSKEKSSHLFAVAALLMSSKFLEKKTLKVNTLNKFSDYQYTPNQIAQAEMNCLVACKFQMPSLSLYVWMEFIISEWDRYISVLFSVPPSSGEYWNGTNTKLDVILFRFPESISYLRYRKLFALVDILILNPDYYKFGHRELAFAVLWNSVYKEFSQDGFKFFFLYGIPGASQLFGNDKEAGKYAKDWILEILLQFSKLYIGEKVGKFDEILEFVQGFIEEVDRVRFGREDRYYASKKDLSDRNYEEMIAVQTYSPNYLMISSLFI